MKINKKLTKDLRKLIDNKIIVDTLFNGVGTKATNATDFFSTPMTKNPLDYDFIVISFTNIGNQYESKKIVMTPKTDKNGVSTYFAATSQYYAYMRVICDNNAIKHRIMDYRGWETTNVYIYNVLGIKISN